MIIISIEDFSKISRIETFLVNLCGFVWVGKRPNDIILDRFIESEEVFNNKNGIYILISKNLMNWDYGFFYKNNITSHEPIQFLTDKDIFKNPEKCKMILKDQK